MNNELTERERELLAHALFRHIAFVDDAGREQLHTIAQKLDVFHIMARYAHTVLAEFEKKIMEQNKKDKDGETNDV